MYLINEADPGNSKKNHGPTGQADIGALQPDKYCLPSKYHTKLTEFFMIYCGCKSYSYDLKKGPNNINRAIQF